MLDRGRIVVGFSKRGKRVFFFWKKFIGVVGPTQPRTQWVTRGFFFGEWSGWGVMRSAHPLLPRVVVN